MKKAIYLLIAVIIFTQNINGQKLVENKAIHFTVDSIDFLVADTSLIIKKPVMLFCQGSQPIPLFIKFDDKGAFFQGGGIANFDMNSVRKAYHLVVISMPETPLVVEKSKLNRNYNYYEDKSNPDVPTKAFMEADYLENYVNRGIRVLNFLKEQTWVDNGKLIIAGHSQGSRVASKIAAQNASVTHLGIFGGNPFGRIDEFVRRARKDAETGKITWEDADRQINEQYDFFRQVNKTGNAETQPELKAWKTFSTPQIHDWLVTDKPIYLAYGTADIAAELCDIVPLYFIQEGKENLTLKRYLNLEHNFFEVKEDGRTDYEKAHWKEVMNTFVEWTK